MTAFTKFANKTATINAPSDVVNGKRSTNTVIKGTLKVMPPFPASRETVMRLELQSPVKMFETYCESIAEIDLYEGYTITIDGILYLVKHVSKWDDFFRKKTYHIVLEDLKVRQNDPDLIIELLSQAFDEDIAFTENYNTTVIIPENETVEINQGVTVQILGN